MPDRDAELTCSKAGPAHDPAKRYRFAEKSMRKF
jgi:hypothetical protein